MAPSNSQNFAMKRLFSEREVAKRFEYVSTWVNLDWQTKLAVGCEEEEACWVWNGVHTSYCWTIIILGAALWASQHSLAGLFPPTIHSFSLSTLFPRQKDNGTSCLSAVNTNTSFNRRRRLSFLSVLAVRRRLTVMLTSAVSLFDTASSEGDSRDLGPWFLAVQSRARWWSVMAAYRLHSRLVTRVRSSSENTSCFLTGIHWVDAGGGTVVYSVSHSDDNTS